MQFPDSQFIAPDAIAHPQPTAGAERESLAEQCSVIAGRENWYLVAHELDEARKAYLDGYGQQGNSGRKAKLEQLLWDDLVTIIQALRAASLPHSPVRSGGLEEALRMALAEHDHRKSMQVMLTEPEWVSNEGERKVDHIGDVNEMDLQGCESCGKEFDVGTMTLMGEYWFCEGCYDEWKKQFDACEHSWEPELSEFGEPGKYCHKCSGFTLDTSQRREIGEIWQELLDKDDRTSPPEYPTMVMISFDELADYLDARPILRSPPDKGHDLSCAADFFDDIEVDDNGKCNWTDVANAQTHLRAALRCWKPDPAWQPISTAPKDGTYVLVYRPQLRDRGCVCTERYDAPHWSSGDCFWPGDPTHWMPLPAAPDTEGR